jgi:sugar lactone lactonase YvrE
VLRAQSDYSSAYAITTLAGGVKPFGSTDATGTNASFYYPSGVAVDSSGNVYVADRYNNKIRKVTATGVVTTLAGSGQAGSTDATGTNASFAQPQGVAVDSSGNVYVADFYNHKVRKVTAAGVVTTLAGSGFSGSNEGVGLAASFDLPSGVAVDSSGNVYVADTGNNKIRKITAAGVVTTLAGSGVQGSTDATGTNASFCQPQGVAVDSSGNVYIADTVNNKIRKVTSAGVVSTLAGINSSQDGIGAAATFYLPQGVAVDSSGSVYVAEWGGNKIRKVTAAGVVTTLAGSGQGGSTDATGTNASFSSPSGVAVDSGGNVYVADSGNNKIRKVTSTGVVTTLAGSGQGGSTDATGTNASLGQPQDVAVDSSGNVYVADTANNKIRKVTAAGVVTTLAGSGQVGSTDATGTNASFSQPHGVAVDSNGNVYVADALNNKIRKVTAAGVVTTLAGSQVFGNNDGIGESASFSYPYGIAVDMQASPIYQPWRVAML